MHGSRGGRGCVRQEAAPSPKMARGGGARSAGVAVAHRRRGGGAATGKKARARRVASGPDQRRAGRPRARVGLGGSGGDVVRGAHVALAYWSGAAAAGRPGGTDMSGDARGFFRVSGGEEDPDSEGSFYSHRGS